MNEVVSRHAALSDEELNLIDAWWRAANYLLVGQIYLMDNPLPREKPLDVPSAGVWIRLTFAPAKPTVIK